MRKTLSLLPKLVLPLVLLCAGCASLIYERAAIDEGFAVDVGVNGAYELFPDVGLDDMGGLGMFGLAPGLRVEMREGFNDRFGIFGRLGADYAPSVKSRPDAQYSQLDVDFSAGVKVAPFASRRSSLRFAIGLPGLVDAYYLYDLNERWTLNGGLGLPRGLSLGATWHVPVNHFITCHVAAEASFPPAAVVGVAIGLPR